MTSLPKKYIINERKTGNLTNEKLPKKGRIYFMLSQIVILMVLILLNAYFAATEIAFISLNDDTVIPTLFFFTYSAIAALSHVIIGIPQAK